MCSCGNGKERTKIKWKKHCFVIRRQDENDDSKDPNLVNWPNVGEKHQVSWTAE